jgi:WD40 repeat protein
LIGGLMLLNVACKTNNNNNETTNNTSDVKNDEQNDSENVDYPIFEYLDDIELVEIDFDKKLNLIKSYRAEEEIEEAFLEDGLYEVSPDGKYTAYVESYDNILIKNSLGNNIELENLEDYMEYYIQDFVFTPDNKYFIVSTGMMQDEAFGNMLLYRVEEDQFYFEKIIENDVYCPQIFITKDGKYLATQKYYWYINIYKIEDKNFTITKTLDEFNSEEIQNIEYDNNRNMLLIKNGIGDNYEYDFASTSLKLVGKDVSYDFSNVYSLNFRPNGNLFLQTGFETGIYKADNEKLELIDNKSVYSIFSEKYSTNKKYNGIKEDAFEAEGMIYGYFNYYEGDKEIWDTYTEDERFFKQFFISSTGKYLSIDSTIFVLLDDEIFMLELPNKLDLQLVNGFSTDEKYIVREDDFLTIEDEEIMPTSLAIESSYLLTSPDGKYLFRGIDNLADVYSYSDDTYTLFASIDLGFDAKNIIFSNDMSKFVVFIQTEEDEYATNSIFKYSIVFSIEDEKISFIGLLSGEYYTAIFSPDGKFVFAGGEKGLDIYEL